MRVIVLMGGSSSEREVSLATGLGVAAALAEAGHQVVALDPHEGKLIELGEQARIGAAPAAVAAPSRPAAELATNHELLNSDAVFCGSSRWNGRERNTPGSS